jgi:hypothetical protein
MFVHTHVYKFLFNIKRIDFNFFNFISITLISSQSTDDVLLYN